MIPRNILWRSREAGWLKAIKGTIIPRVKTTALQNSELTLRWRETSWGARNAGWPNPSPKVICAVHGSRVTLEAGFHFSQVRLVPLDVLSPSHFFTNCHNFFFREKGVAGDFWIQNTIRCYRELGIGQHVSSILEDTEKATMANIYWGLTMCQILF